MKELGILLVSHVYDIPVGIKRLLDEVANEVSITIAGGTDTNEIGTSFDLITDAINQNEGKKVLAFYDLGSAKMKLEMIIEDIDKDVEMIHTPLVEGSYAAAVLIQAGLNYSEVLKQLEPLIIK